MSKVLTEGAEVTDNDSDKAHRPRWHSTHIEQNDSAAFEGADTGTNGNVIGVR